MVGEPPDVRRWDPKASTLRRAALGESTNIEVWVTILTPAVDTRQEGVVIFPSGCRL